MFFFHSQKKNHLRHESFFHSFRLRHFSDLKFEILLEWDSYLINQMSSSVQGLLQDHDDRRVDPTPPTTTATTRTTTTTTATASTTAATGVWHGRSEKKIENSFRSEKKSRIFLFFDMILLFRVQCSQHIYFSSIFFYGDFGTGLGLVLFSTLDFSGLCCFFLVARDRPLLRRLYDDPLEDTQVSALSLYLSI
mgnify:CR=1 FL=1